MTSADSCLSFNQLRTDFGFMQRFTPQHRQYSGSSAERQEIQAFSAGPSTIFQTEPTASWSIRLSHNIERLRRLSHGWDGPRSLAIDNSLLNRVNALVRESLAPLGKNARAPFVVPLPSGGVQVEWHTMQGELELELGADGATTLWIKDHSTEYEFETEGVKALNQFLHWVPRLAQEKPDVADVQIATTAASFAAAA